MLSSQEDADRFLISISEYQEVNGKDEQGNTPLLLAAALNLPDVIINGLESYDINTQNNEGKTALHFAAENNNFELLKFFISKGADLEAVDNNGWTILHSAAAGVIDVGNDWDVIKLLLSYNLDIEHKNKDNKMVIDFFKDYSASHAEKYNELLTHSQLLKAIKNADIQKLKESHKLDYHDKYGDSLLHHAVRAKNLDVIKFLVKEKGINVNVKSKLGDTPLHLAVLKGKIDLVKSLLKMGADTNAESSIAGTPLSLASELGEKEIFKALLSYTTTIHDIKGLFNSAAIGIIDNNQSCWEIIQELLKVDNNDEHYKEARQTLEGEHWLYTLKFDSLINTSTYS